MKETVMPDIHVLPPILANQIAAGEVVERPASIVKELVENSVDAGASCITVSIFDGGISSISVVDNGCGIKSNQCKDAFLRHATSKIQCTDDLSSIESLGFRGEALASIAAVSAVTMTTRTAESEMGIALCIDAGEIQYIKEVACTQGTSVKVENLFSKVPARLRFLKPARFEAGYCADYISRMILARPDISFKYTQDGKTIYESFGDNNLKNTIFSVYGNHVFSHVLPVDFDDGYLKIDGYIGTQEVSHANRSFESFFINGRFIRSTALANAVENAFLTKIMVGRYPFSVIRITIAPKEVDVNIHPAKTQIRFINESRVCDSVSQACSAALKAVVIPKINISASAVINKHSYFKETPSDLDNKDKELVRLNDDQKGSPFRYSVLSTQSDAASSKQITYSDIHNSYSYSSFEQKSHETDIPVYSVPSSENQRPALKRQEIIQDSLPISKDYKLIGCAFNAYWIIEYDNNLYLIDQHAACERKLYERIMADDRGSASQALLLPVSISLPPNDFELAEKYRNELEKLGFRYLKSERLSYSVEAVPFINGVLFEANYLCEALSLIEKTGKAAPSDLIYESLVYASCKHSIKAGEKITEEEMTALINQYIDESIPLTCPHGRPVMIKISKQEIEKGFKRIV